MSNMNFNCDVCGREVQGCTFVNGMKFCAKCYQETFGETEKDRKIADLEAKLAEKEKEIESLKENWNVLCDYLGECIVKYDEIDTDGIYSEVLKKVNKLKKYDTSIAKTQNQKAIEQLEKVKEFVNDIYGEYSASVTTNFINNQIEELKKEK